MNNQNDHHCPDYYHDDDDYDPDHLQANNWRLKFEKEGVAKIEELESTKMKLQVKMAVIMMIMMILVKMVMIKMMTMILMIMMVLMIIMLVIMFTRRPDWRSVKLPWKA